MYQIRSSILFKGGFCLNEEAPVFSVIHTTNRQDLLAVFASFLSKTPSIVSYLLAKVGNRLKCHRCSPILKKKRCSKN